MAEPPATGWSTGWATRDWPPPESAYAPTGARVRAYALDTLFTLAPLTVAVAGGALIALGYRIGDDTPLILMSGGALLVVLGILGAFGVWAWNAWQQGVRGAGFGKRKVGLVLLDAETGWPVGGGVSLWREVLRAVDGLALGVGYLRARRDPRHQTLCDKLAGTVVVRRESP